MSIAEELDSKLKYNKHYIHITDADDLLAAWRHRRETDFKRSFNFAHVPTEFRLSAPPDENSPCLPCHVKLRRLHNSYVTRSIRPAPELSTIDCHGHGNTAHFSLDDLDALETVTFANRNVAPYVSPVLDTVTLSLVCKDLGIHGRAVPKIINGRQYIAFSGYPGLRSMFPGTIYSANNHQIIRMAIGALGIKNMVKTGGILTICLTVPLTILEAFLNDQHSIYDLVGELSMELSKIGVASVMGAIFGIATGGIIAYAFAPIAVAIVVSVGTGFGLNVIDDKYQLTKKLSSTLEKMSNQLTKVTKNGIDEAQKSLYHGLEGFIRGQTGYRGPF